MRTLLDRRHRALYLPSTPQPKQIWAVVFGLVNVLNFVRGSKIDHDMLASSAKNVLGEPAEDSDHDKDHLNRKNHGSTALNLPADIEESLDSHGLDISFMALKALSVQPTAQEVMQIVINYQRPEFLAESMMKTATSNRKFDIAVWQLLLQQQGASASLKEGVLMQLMLLLLREQDADISKIRTFIKAAARDSINPNIRELILLLLDEPGASTLITEEVWMTISGLDNSTRSTIVNSLLGRITITEETTATFVRLFGLIDIDEILATT